MGGGRRFQAVTVNLQEYLRNILVTLLLSSSRCRLKP